LQQIVSTQSKVISAQTRALAETAQSARISRALDGAAFCRGTALMAGEEIY
jgi:hypothetical protein